MKDGRDRTGSGGPLAEARPVRPYNQHEPVHVGATGPLAGGLAKLIFPGKDPGGCLATMFIGIMGGDRRVPGDHRLRVGTVTGFNLKSLGIAVAGSLVLLALFRLITHRR
jgi:uncharacterized membrane protein YeaQ/YmgE (transglycosylase-associated protein family)